jgi:AcrR family transcriptional regulator
MNPQSDQNAADPANRQAHRTRLSPEMRKAKIAQVAAEVFARAGFAAAGFRDVARASHTSEALIYRYFPTKQALWEAALAAVRSNAASQFIRQGQIGEPSTRTLVDLTLELSKRFFSIADTMQPANRETLNRMLLRSLSEDADFARHMFATLDSGLSGDFKNCLRAARNAGDMESSSIEDRLLSSLYFNIFFLVSSLDMHELISRKDNLDDRNKLILDIVEFQLRAIGLRAEAANREMVRIRAQEI